MIKDIIDAVKRKMDEESRQRNEISNRLSKNKMEKAAAEEAKKAALEAKDEQAYKDACRAIADSEAGIEFNKICLETQRAKLYATGEENRDIKRAMRREVAEIWLEALNEIETAFDNISKVSSLAIEKLNAVNVMEESWDENVMKGTNPKTSLASGDKGLLLNQYKSRADAALDVIRKIHKGYRE